MILIKNSFEINTKKNYVLFVQKKEIKNNKEFNHISRVEQQLVQYRSKQSA